MKILHVIDPGSPGGGACTLRLLAEPCHRLRSIRQDVLIVGSQRHVELARSCGLDPVGSICPPVGYPVTAWRTLRQWISSREPIAGAYDLIHAWTAQSAILVSAALPDHRRVGSLPIGPVSGITTQYLTILLDRSPMPLIASSTAVKDEYRSIGIDPELVNILPPAVNPESSPSDDREALRARWGVDDATVVVGLLSEPVSWADMRHAIDVVARVAVSGRKVRLLCHHTATRRRSAERFASNIDMLDLLIMEDRVAEPWRIVNGLDVAMLIGGPLNTMDLRGAGSPFAALIGGGRRLRPMPGVMPLLWAMSAGVPVIAEASSAVSDIVDDGQTGLLVGQHDVNAAADRLCRIHDDPTIAGRLGMNARGFVQKNFHVSSFCVRLKDFYQRLTAARAGALVGHGNDDVIEQRDPHSMKWQRI